MSVIAAAMFSTRFTMMLSMMLSTTVLTASALVVLAVMVAVIWLARRSGWDLGRPASVPARG